MFQLISELIKLMFSGVTLLFEVAVLTIAGIAGLFTGCLGTVLGGIAIFFLVLMLL